MCEGDLGRTVAIVTMFNSETVQSKKVGDCEAVDELIIIIINCKHLPVAN